MSKNPTYTTGQVSGMTGLAFMTLYRYVKLFGEFFGPNVQKHIRGRRWSDDDVTIALSIQALFNRRTGEDGIRQALRDGYKLDQSPEGNPLVQEAFSMLYETCQLYREEAKKDRAAAHELTIKLAQLYKHNRDDPELLLNLQKSIQNHSVEITRLNTSKKAFINFGR